MSSENRAEIRHQPIGRTEAERRELEAVGWEPKGRGAKTLWCGIAGGRWYAHYHAVETHRRSELDAEEERLLHVHGFEREPVEGYEVWSRYEREGLRLYMRSKALEKARKRARNETKVLPAGSVGARRRSDRSASGPAAWTA